MESPVEAGTPGGKKRRRVRPEKWSQGASNREEELYQQALANSRQEKAMVKLPIEEAPTFRPSEAEFGGNPMAYIESIRPEAEKCGICVIVPPESWNPSCAIDVETSELEFGTKAQRIDRLQESLPYGDGAKYTPTRYKGMADDFQANWVKDHGSRTIEELQRDYWTLVDGATTEVLVEYGNDVDGTAFVEESDWNLTTMPKKSLLRHFEVQLPGVNTPWLYFGMLFSTFSWHNEDNYLASINYHHLGAPKQWYGVPGSHAAAFEGVVRRFYKQRLLEVPDLLHHMNTMFSPSKLKALNVPVYQALQRAGTFVVTFPQAFHSGFSYGFNLGEAVNLAPPSWLKHARIATERYRRVGRLAVMSHDRLVFTLAKFAKDYSSSFDENLLLRSEVHRLCTEEFNLRPRLFLAGVRDVSNLITPPSNTLGAIDAVSSDYDDKRVCVVCRHTCFSSAVACNCSQTAVACLRHSSYLCKCPSHNKYLIQWETVDALKAVLGRLDEHIAQKFPQESQAARQKALKESQEAAANQHHHLVHQGCLPGEEPPPEP